jgi:hypothetical protein
LGIQSRRLNDYALGSQPAFHFWLNCSDFVVGLDGFDRNVVVILQEQDEKQQTLDN